ISQIGIAPALYLNAISFVPVMYALYLMREADLFKVVMTIRGSVWAQLKEGLVYTWNTPQVLVIIIVLAAIGTFGYNFTILLPLIANYVLKVGADGFGALSSFLGLGSLIAAIGTAYVTKLRLRYVLIGAGAFSILLGLTAVTPIFGISAAILALLGAAGIVFMTTANSMLQLLVPDELRGRVLSLSVLLVMGSTPIGAFLIGLMSEHLGVPAAILTCASLCLLGVIVALVYQRRHFSPATIKPAQAHLQTAAGD
ncbi:MAG: MFS transporter, partial [Chloroflexota bacterium]